MDMSCKCWTCRFIRLERMIEAELKKRSKCCNWCGSQGCNSGSDDYCSNSNCRCCCSRRHRKDNYCGYNK